MDDSTIFTFGMFLLAPAIIIALLLAGRMRPRIGCGMVALLPVCAFCGVMVATAGGALHLPLATVGAPYVCDGAVETQQHGYSYKPGQRGVSHTVFCVAADGTRRDITLRTIGAASIYYTIILFAAALLLLGLVRLVKPRRAAGPLPLATHGLPPPAVEVIQNFLARRLNTSVEIVRPADRGAASIEQRLRHLQSLRAEGLVSEEEYQAKRAEILAGL